MDRRQRCMIARSAAVCVLRNAVDILPLLIGHYLHAGFDRICFVDDGSTDGSRELLGAVSARTRRMTVVDHNASTFDQRRLINDQVNDLIAEGFSLVVPFDMDEFWMLDVPRITSACDFGASCIIRGRWVNFVQARHQAEASTAALCAIRYRVPNADRASREEVTEFRRGFVSVQLSKVAVWTSEPVLLSRGRHSVKQGPTKKYPAEMEILHVPLRNRAEIGRRAIDYAARTAPFDKGRTNWQSKFFADAVGAGHADDVWSANSADERGALSLRTGSYPLVVDHRFRLTALAALQQFEAVFGW